MREKKQADIMLTVRLPGALVAQVDALALDMAKDAGAVFVHGGGGKIPRAVVMRLALASGIEQLSGGKPKNS